VHSGVWRCGMPSRTAEFRSRTRLPSGTTSSRSHQHHSLGPTAAGPIRSISVVARQRRPPQALSTLPRLPPTPRPPSLGVRHQACLSLVPTAASVQRLLRPPLRQVLWPRRRARGTGRATRWVSGVFAGRLARTWLILLDSLLQEKVWVV
jgi:hypothetical protein